MPPFKQEVLLIRFASKKKLSTDRFVIKTSLQATVTKRAVAASKT